MAHGWLLSNFHTVASPIREATLSAEDKKMRIEEKPLVFDTENPLCTCKITNSQGRLYGFFTFIDEWWIPLEKKHSPTKKDTRQYWGEIEWDKDGVEIPGHGKVSIDSIIEVMRTGGKWSKFES